MECLLAHTCTHNHITFRFQKKLASTLSSPFLEFLYLSAPSFWTHIQMYLYTWGRERRWRQLSLLASETNQRLTDLLPSLLATLKVFTVGGEEGVERLRKSPKEIASIFRMQTMKTRGLLNPFGKSGLPPVSIPWHGEMIKRRRTNTLNCYTQ